MKTILHPPLFLVLVLAAHGGPRTSTNYSTATETTDSGGQAATSSNYSQTGSLGGITGISNVESPSETAKHGYLGQLYEVVGVEVTASPSAVAEGGTRQLQGSAQLDDLTLLELPGSVLGWSVGFGPITDIGTNGLASAGLVYADTPASVQGTYLGFGDVLGLTVLDTVADNYNEYGGDGVSDDWQVGNFGEPPNDDAGPGDNPDHDFYDNLFESLTGSDPNDGADFFRFHIQDRSAETATLRLSKVIPGTIYTIKRSADLGVSVPFAPFPSSTFSVESEAFDYEVIDIGTAGPTQFYRLEVEAE